MTHVWKKPNFQTIISLFIVLHLFAIITNCFRSVYAFPVPLLNNYIHLFGLYQGWSMFESAPVADYYLCAVLKTKSGQTRVVEFNHMDNLEWSSRLQLHQFKKFQQTHLFNPNNAFLYPQVCLWILRGLDSKTRGQIDSILLYKKAIYFAGSQGEKTFPLCEFKFQSISK